VEEVEPGANVGGWKPTSLTSYGRLYFPYGRPFV
jgi:hypothetical protein